MDRLQTANSAAAGSRRKSGGAKHRLETRRIEFDRWLFASAVALGVGAAMAGGSGVAHADASGTGGTKSSGDHKGHPAGVAHTAAPTSHAATPPPAGGGRNAAGNTASSARAVTISPVNSRTATPSTASRSTTPVSTASQLGSPAPLAASSTTTSVDPPAAPTKQPTVLALVAAVAPHLAKAAAPAPLALNAWPGSPTSLPVLSGVLGSLLLGARPAASNSGQAAGSATAVTITETPTPTNATVPLQVHDGTEPVVDISIAGGKSEPFLVDTGSKGLVVGLRDVNVFKLGWPTGFGISGYSGGLTYLYATFTTTVNFGNGIVTRPTSVDVALLSFPGSFESFVSGDSAVGILGVGPNASGPGPSSVIGALPGDLSDGVLIDEPDGVLEFGPNPLPARASVTGSPGASLMVKIDNGPLEPVSALIDSGGVYGTIPSSVATNLPAGTIISVYTADGRTLLYSYVVDGSNTPTVTSGGALNTGYEAFAQQPVYISYSPKGVGTTIFDV
jgi:hypothetical protein